MKRNIKSRNINKPINIDALTSFGYSSYDKAVLNTILFPNLMHTSVYEKNINNPNQTQRSLEKPKTLNKTKINLKKGSFNSLSSNNFVNNNNYTSFSQNNSTKNFFKNQTMAGEKTNRATQTNYYTNIDVNYKSQLIQDINTNKFNYNSPNKNYKNSIATTNNKQSQKRIHNVYFGQNKEEDEIISTDIFAKTSNFNDKKNYFHTKNKIKIKDKNENNYLILSDKEKTRKKKLKKNKQINNFDLNNELDFFDPITLEKNEELVSLYSKERLKEKNILKNLQKQNIKDNCKTEYPNENNEFCYTMKDFKTQSKSKKNNDTSNKYSYYDKNNVINTYNNYNGYINSYNYNNNIYMNNFSKYDNKNEMTSNKIFQINKNIESKNYNKQTNTNQKNDDFYFSDSPNHTSNKYQKPSDFIKDLSEKVLQKFLHKYPSSTQCTNSTKNIKTVYISDPLNMMTKNFSGQLIENTPFKNLIRKSKDNNKNDSKITNKFIKNNSSKKLTQTKSKFKISQKKLKKKEITQTKNKEDLVGNLILNDDYLKQKRESIISEKNDEFEQQKENIIFEGERNNYNNDSPSIAQNKNEKILIEKNKINYNMAIKSLIVNSKKTKNAAKNVIKLFKKINKNKEINKESLDEIYGFNKNILDQNYDFIKDITITNTPNEDNVENNFVNNLKNVFFLLTKENKTEKDLEKLFLNGESIKSNIQLFMEELQKNTLVNKLDEKGNIISSKNNSTVKNKKDLTKISKNFTTIAKFYKHLRYLESKIEKELENYQYHRETDNKNDIGNNSLLFIISNNDIKKQDKKGKEKEKEKENIQQISNENKFLLSINKNENEIDKPKIKKEIEDIINTNYSRNKFKRKTNNESYFNKFKGIHLNENKHEFHSKRKAKKKSVIGNYGNIKKMQDIIETINDKKNQEDDKIKKEKILQKRMRNFFNKIQCLKNSENVGEEIEQLINDNIGENEYLEDRNIESRKKKFFKNFEYTRTFYKNNQSRNKLIFSSPALFKTCDFKL